jgi:hypothetical protein
MALRWQVCKVLITNSYHRLPASSSLVNCEDFGTIPESSDLKGIIGNIHHGGFETKKSQRKSGNSV